MVLDKRTQHEEEMWNELEECMASWDTEKRRTSTLSTTVWQIAQSNAAKAENLEKDFIEASSKAQELGWSEGKSNPKCWLEKTCDSDS